MQSAGRNDIQRLVIDNAGWSAILFAPVTLVFWAAFIVCYSPCGSWGIVGSVASGVQNLLLIPVALALHERLKRTYPRLSLAIIAVTLTSLAGAAILELGPAAGAPFYRLSIGQMDLWPFLFLGGPIALWWLATGITGAFTRDLPAGVSGPAIAAGFAGILMVASFYGLGEDFPLIWYGILAFVVLGPIWAFRLARLLRSAKIQPTSSRSRIQ